MAISTNVTTFTVDNAIAQSCNSLLNQSCIIIIYTHPVESLYSGHPWDVQLQVRVSSSWGAGNPFLVQAVRLYESAYPPSEFRTSQPGLYVLIRLLEPVNS